MLDLLLGLGQVQLSSCECAVQAALLCIQAQGVLMASKFLPLHLGRNIEETGLSGMTHRSSVSNLTGDLGNLGMSQWSRHLVQCLPEGHTVLVELQG